MPGVMRSFDVITRQHLGTPFFEYDASLVRDRCFSHPAPHAGDLIKFAASATVMCDATSAGGHYITLEVIARFPGGLDFGRGLVDIDYAM